MPATQLCAIFWNAVAQSKPTARVTRRSEALVEPFRIMGLRQALDLAKENGRSATYHPVIPMHRSYASP